MAEIVFYTYKNHLNKTPVYRIGKLLNMFEKNLLITHHSLLNPLVWLEMINSRCLVMTASSGFPEKFLQRFYKLMKKPIVQIQHGEGLRFTKTTLKKYDKIHWCVYGDGIRNEMINKGFPSEQVHVTGMLHWDELHKYVGQKRVPTIKTLLLMQPLVELNIWESWQLDEFLNGLTPDVEIQLHPLNNPKLFGSFRTHTTNLHENILKSEEVIGIYSTAMYEAALLGKKVTHIDPYFEHDFQKNHFTKDNVSKMFREVDGKAHKRVAGGIKGGV